MNRQLAKGCSSLLAAITLLTGVPASGVLARASAAPRPADRILSLSASATQMLYAIGAGHQVVGVDKYSTWPPSAPRTKFTGAETSAEDYLYLKPDLVVFAYATNVVGQLKKLGVRALVLGPPSTLSGIYAQIGEIGSVTGHQSGAAALESSMKSDLLKAVATAGSSERGSSYYIELDPKYYYTATSSTFIGAEFSLFGLKDIADAAAHGSDFPAISAEYLLKADPDYVFLADTVCCRQTAATFGARPGFSALQSVRDHHVIAVDDSVASQWGPHTVETFASVIARALR